MSKCVSPPLRLTLGCAVLLLLYRERRDYADTVITMELSRRGRYGSAGFHIRGWRHVHGYGGWC